jgi:hypothetical protein
VTGALTAGQYVAGLLLLALTIACAVAVAAMLVGRRLGHLRGAPRATALGLLVVADLLLVHLVPLMLGVLTRGTAPLTALLVTVAVWKLVPPAPVEPTHSARDADPAPSARSADPAPSARSADPAPEAALAVKASMVLAAAGALLTAGYVLAFLQRFATVHPTGIDALNFHLPSVIRFIQSGTLWQTTEYVPGFAFGNYPQSGDLLLLAAVLPWHSLALVRFVNPFLLALAATAIYATARELRAPAPTAVLGACAVIVMKPVVTPALIDVQTDATFLAGFSAGALFLVRHWRNGRRSELVLAGLGLGIALGTKWYGLTDVPVLIVLWALGAAIAGRPARAVGRNAAVLIATVAVAGGIWMLRNLILAGNPVFDYKVSLLGTTIFNAPPSAIRAVGGFSIAHYLGQPHILRIFVWPIWRGDYGLIGALFMTGAAAALVLGVVARLRREGARARQLDPRIALLAVAAFAVAAAYVITPYSAQGPSGRPLQVASNTRYGVPALLLAAPVLAWIGGRLRNARPALEIVLLAAVAIGLHRHLDVPLSHVALAAVVVALVAACCWWVAGDREAIAADGGRTRAARPVATLVAASADGRVRGALAGVAVAAACAAAGLAYHYQRVLARTPYAPSDPAVDYVLAHAPAHARIGLIGGWSVNGLSPVTPMFGPRLDNRVYYVGHFVEHMLRQYDDPAQFVSALRRGRYRLLVLGTRNPPFPPPMDQLLVRQAGFLPVARSPRLVLFAATT